MSTLIEAAALLRGAPRVLAISHIAPDGDAIGSLLGFGWILQRAGIGGQALVLACADPVPDQYQWLPGADTIVAAPRELPWDVVVGLDASDPQRLGAPFRSAARGNTPVVVLDHHVTNLGFGTLNCVDTAAVATSQMVVGLADELGVALDRNVATCLLTGIVTDTLGFRTNNVTPAVMAVAMRLMQAGASLSEVTERTLNHKPLATLRLWGLALADVRLQDRVAWARTTQAMRDQVAAPRIGDGGLVSQLINAPEAVVAAVFSETPEGRVEIGFRSKAGHDVSKVALSLGGGGHPQASGCTIDGPIEAAEARVVPMLLNVAR